MPVAVQSVQCESQSSLSCRLEQVSQQVSRYRGVVSSGGSFSAVIQSMSPVATGGW